MENKGKETNEEVVKPNVPKKKISIDKIIKKLWKALGFIIMILILFISATILTQRFSNNEKAFLGFRIFRVQTGSMVPKYLVGDVILVKQKDTNKIEVGEDVTYFGESGTMKGKIVTHRVIQIEEIDGERVFHTQGIANTKEDPVVYADQIDGIVLCKMNVLTWICNGLSNKYILYFGVIIPLTIYIFFSIAKDKHDVIKDNQN